MPIRPSFLRTFRCAFAVTLALAAAGHARAAVEVAGRHVYVVHGGVDILWGSYLFLVSNTGAGPEEATFPVALPQETTDWQVQDGLEAGDVRLGDAKGSLVIHKTFPPGDSFVAIGFKVPASQGEARMTVRPQSPLANFTVFTQEGKLGLAGDGFAFKEKVPFSGSVYDTISRDEVAPGTELRMTVSRIAEGRGSYWLLGGSLGAVLVIAGFGLAYRSRPKPQELGHVVA